MAEEGYGKISPRCETGRCGADRHRRQLHQIVRQKHNERLPLVAGVCARDSVTGWRLYAGAPRRCWDVRAINVVRYCWHALVFFGGRRGCSTCAQVCNEGAGKGLLLGRKAVANEFSVPVEHIHSLPRGMMGNIDDMVYMYSTEQYFVVTNKEKGFVLKDNVNGPLNSSYGVHRVQTKFDGKEFKAIKFR